MNLKWAEATHISESSNIEVEHEVKKYTKDVYLT